MVVGTERKSFVGRFFYFFLAFRESNPDIVKYMKEHNITGKPSLLEKIYLDKLFKIIESYPANKSYAG